MMSILYEKVIILLLDRKIGEIGNWTRRTVGFWLKQGSRGRASRTTAHEGLR